MDYIFLSLEIHEPYMRSYTIDSKACENKEYGIKQYNAFIEHISPYLPDYESYFLRLYLYKRNGINLPDEFLFYKALKELFGRLIFRKETRAVLEKYFNLGELYD